jgi:hypothetical protein
MVVSMRGALTFIVSGIAALGLNATLVGCAARDDSHPESSGPRSTQPSQVVASPAGRCGPSDVAVALGRHDAWHGMTAQNVTLRNVAHEPCVLHVDDLRHVDVGLRDERWIDVDLSPVGGSRFLIQPGRGVSLMFGADALSADCGPIARTVRVTFAGSEPAVLSGAWVAVGCERPKAIDVYPSDGSPSSHSPAHAVPTEHRLRGTNGDDVLVGTSGRDLINGLRGSDIIRGRAGDDELRDYSGVGTGEPLDATRDVFYGGSGDDVIYASQHDRVFAGPGDDRIYGDYLKPGDVIHCGPGWDVVTTNDDFPGIVLRGCEKLRVEYAG